MRATCWSDYLCPWCYVGQTRSAQMAALGVEVVHLPYELHPEIPVAGRRVRPDGRLAPTYARIAVECEAAGLAWQAPTRMPNTRRALETAEVVRRRFEDAFATLHAGLFDAHFARGEALDDPAVLDRLVGDAGAPMDVVRAAVDRGDGAALVDHAMVQAREVGVTSTPTWVLDTGLVVPGALDPATLDRWITKIRSRQGA